MMLINDYDASDIEFFIGLKQEKKIVYHETMKSTMIDPRVGLYTTKIGAYQLELYC